MFGLLTSRTIMGIKLVEWHNMLNLLTAVTLSLSRDKFVWTIIRMESSLSNLYTIFDEYFQQRTKQEALKT
jgi:hypothetical protein